MWRDENTPDPVFTDSLELDMSSVEPALAGPKRPQDRVLLSAAKAGFEKALPELVGPKNAKDGVPVAANGGYTLKNGDVVIAAITSCTNTSNPAVLVAAGLLARNAAAKGLKTKPWVKTSFAPGSQVVTDYMVAADLQKHLDALGFTLAGYGCTTCIGNSGPLPDEVAAAIDAGDLTVTAVLSGNRNFEGRVHAQVKANYLASPPLVVAYALAGSLLKDITTEPLGMGKDGPVYLKDVWPSNQEITDTIRKTLTAKMFKDRYANVFKGDANWQKMGTSAGMTYKWQPGSTYVKLAPYFEELPKEAGTFADISGARPLAILGDSITTDHISPAGSIKKDGPAGNYLIEHQVRPDDFNSFGARRGNHEIMMRGTFANVRIKNLMIPAQPDGSRVEGGITIHQPSGEEMSIYDAAMKYIGSNVPTMIFAGEEYGTGSSRDWAAKGTQLLGVKAVVARSFERIHRSNLVGMGVLPLQFIGNDSVQSLNITGNESFDLLGLEHDIKPQQEVTLVIKRANGQSQQVKLLLRIDTPIEVDYYRHGGILPFVLRQLLAA
jgi:aconitate hydratase